MFDPVKEAAVKLRNTVVRDEKHRENNTLRGKGLTAIFKLDPDDDFSVGGYLAFRVVIRTAKNLRLRLEIMAANVVEIDKTDPRSLRKILARMPQDERAGWEEKLEEKVTREIYDRMRVPGCKKSVPERFNGLARIPEIAKHPRYLDLIGQAADKINTDIKPLFKEIPKLEIKPAKSKTRNVDRDTGPSR